MTTMIDFVFVLLSLAVFISGIEGAPCYDRKGSSECRSLPVSSNQVALREVIATNQYTTYGEV
jgi:hypothetical protein